MNDPGRKETLEREAIAYIKLGTLVQRRRSSERAEQVAQVLAAPIPAEEKIRRIERIDAQPVPAGERRLPTRSPASVPASPSQKRMKESVIAAARHRARRKADIVPSTFMKYLFKEGREIRTKAKANTFIKAGLLKITLESEAVRAFLEHTKKKLLPILSSALDAALKEGWHFLRKEEYNLLAALKRLVSDVDGLQVQAETQGYAPPSRRLFGIEIAFLTFVAYRGASAIGKDRLFGLGEVLSRISYPEKTAEESLAAGALLLKDGGPPPCLQDFILAVNMVRSRRFLSISDLMRPEGEALVSTSEFDCDDEVQDAIDAHIGSLLVRLDELGEEGEEILRLRAFVQRNAEGDIDFSPLSAFYESGELSKRSWEKDEDNAVLLLAGLTERFLALIEPLFVAPKTQASAQASALAAARPSFPRGGGAKEAPKADDGLHVEDQELEYDVSRLRTSLTKLMRTMDSLPSLPGARFQAIRAQAVQATKFEAEGIGVLIEVSDEFYRIGVKLASLLRAREELPQKTAEEALAGDSGGASLDDLALRSLLSSLVSISFLIALRFQEPSIVTALKNERQSEDQRRSVLEEIERIADSLTFRLARGKTSPALSEEG
ncbi:MAG TPA: hypothetical protein VMV44_07670 [Rectinemataceae bacterium]|nr:hypothetical protein [Rectinemataceae bacterium]